MEEARPRVSEHLDPEASLCPYWLCDSGQITEPLWVSLCSCKIDTVPSNPLILQGDWTDKSCRGTRKVERCPLARWSYSKCLLYLPVVPVLRQARCSAPRT